MVASYHAQNGSSFEMFIATSSNNDLIVVASNDSYSDVVLIATRESY